MPIYHIERVVTETNELFDDGEHIIYVNGAFKDDGSELGTLIKDFREVDPDKVKTKSLASRIKYLKESEEGVSHMCRIMEDIVQSERVQSFIEGLIAAGLSEFKILVSKVVEKFDIPQADAEDAVRRYSVDTH